MTLLVKSNKSQVHVKITQHVGLDISGALSKNQLQNDRANTFCQEDFLKISYCVKSSDHQQRGNFDHWAII